MNNDIAFEIMEQIAIIQTYPTEWKRELNLVAWNGNPERYDIRDWDPSHMHMSRGITLSKNEAYALMEALCSHFDVKIVTK